MATSGTFTEHSNNLAIVSAALRKINRLGDFETLTDTDVRYTAALVTLKHIVKEFATVGMPLWAIEELDIPFSNFTTISGITIGPQGSPTVTNAHPQKIIAAVRRDNTEDLDYPMELYTQDRYLEIPEKDATGAPLAFTYYPNEASIHPTQGRLKVWPLPDSYWTTNGSIRIRYQRPIEDVGTSTQDLDFPSYWQRAIVYTLAYDLAPDYGVDINLRGMLKKDKEDLYDRALGHMTEEGSLFIQPARRR